MVFRGIGLPGRAVLRMAFVILWVHVFVEFMAIDLLKFARAPGPSGDRGDMPLMAHGADGGACRLLYAVHQMLSLWSLYRCGSWSPRPQPLGSGGDTTPCEDTRGDLELFFNELA